MGKQTAAQRAWYERHTEEIKRKSKERRQIQRTKLRTYLHEFKSSSCCEICGESDIACLDFHHTDPSKKEFTIAAGVGEGMSLERFVAEIEKCRILCSNCHRKLHYYE